MSWITGLHAIEELLNDTVDGAELFIAGKGKRVEYLRGLARRQGIAVRSVSSSELKQRAGTQARVLALKLTKPQTGSRSRTLEEVLIASKPPSLIMAVDGVTDPHNLGAIMRSADQVGAAALLVPARRSAGMSDTVMRTSAGAATHLQTISVSNLSRALESCKDAGYWIYAADAGGTSVLDTPVHEMAVLVLGSEGKGPGRNTLRHSDAVVSIPSQGHVDSFNVSVAAGILAFEFRRLQGYWS